MGTLYEVICPYCDENVKVDGEQEGSSEWEETITCDECGKDFVSFVETACTLIATGTTQEEYKSMIKKKE